MEGMRRVRLGSCDSGCARTSKVWRGRGPAAAIPSSHSCMFPSTGASIARSAIASAASTRHHRLKNKWMGPFNRRAYPSVNSLRRDRLARARKDGRGTARPSSGGSCVEAAVSGDRTKRDCGDVRNFQTEHRTRQLGEQRDQQISCIFFTQVASVRPAISPESSLSSVKDSRCLSPPLVCR